MSPARLLVRAAVASVTTIALVSGVSPATAAGSAPSAPSAVSARTSAATTEAAAQCQSARAAVAQARKNLRVAKRRLERAKRLDRPARVIRERRVAVRKAKRVLERRQNRATYVCRRARDMAAAEQKSNEQKTTYIIIREQVTNSALPADLTGPLVVTLDGVVAQLDGVTDSLPLATNPELTAILAQLEGLDPTALQAAVTALIDQLTALGGDAAGVATLLDAVLGGLPGGTDLPVGDLGDLAGTFEGLLAAITAVDPAAQTGQLDGLLAALTDATAALQNLPATVTAFLDELAALGGGLPTDPAVLGGVIEDLIAAGSGGDLGLLDGLDFLGLTLGSDLTGLVGSAEALLGGDLVMPTPLDLLLGLLGL